MGRGSGAISCHNAREGAGSREPPKHRGNANGARTPASDHNQPLTKDCEAGRCIKGCLGSHSKLPTPDAKATMGLLDTTTALPTEPTWGAALRTIERERTMPSWERIGQKAPARDHIFTHYEKRGHFNALPTRQDPKREQKFRDNRDAAFCQASALQAAASVLRHRLPPPDGRFKARARFRSTKNGKPKPPDTNTKWNIITHVGREGCEPFTSSKDRLAAAHGELLPASWKRREYDIVSTKYTESHGGHHRDRENAKHKAQKKFWETRDFDFIKIKYHDDDKESDFQQQRSHLNSIAGAGAMAKLPPAMQYCEGAAYNLVSHEIKDASKLEVSNAVTNSGVASKMGAAVDKHHKNVAEERYQRDKRRALQRFNKTSHLKEMMDGRHHDYDVVTGESFYGRNPKFRAPSRLQRAPTTWDRLAASGPSILARLLVSAGPVESAGGRRRRPSPCAPGWLGVVAASVVRARRFRASPRVVDAPVAPAPSAGRASSENPGAVLHCTFSFCSEFPLAEVAMCLALLRGCSLSTAAGPTRVCVTERAARPQPPYAVAPVATRIPFTMLPSGGPDDRDRLERARSDFEPVAAH